MIEVATRTSLPPEEIPALACGISKSFGKVEALRGVSLEVRPSEVLALLGPNGAGKTTALSILLGLRRPDRGSVRLFGLDPGQTRARRAVGVTPQETAFPETLRVQEIVELVRAHYPHPQPGSALLRRFGLAGLERRQAGGLSGGQKRRLAVALAFAGNPRAVFLDEPTTGLDVQSRRQVWEAIRAYAFAGGTVLLTTHYLDEAEALASRVAVMSAGRLIVEGRVPEIKALAGIKRVRLRAGELPALPGVVRSVCEEGLWTLDVEDAGQVVETLVRRDVPLDGLEVLPVGLEEAFLLLTKEGR